MCEEDKDVYRLTMYKKLRAYHIAMPPQPLPEIGAVELNR